MWIGLHLRELSTCTIRQFLSKAQTGSEESVDGLVHGSHCWCWVIAGVIMATDAGHLKKVQRVSARRSVMSERAKAASSTRPIICHSLEPSLSIKVTTCVLLNRSGINHPVGCDVSNEKCGGDKLEEGSHRLQRKIEKLSLWRGQVKWNVAKNRRRSSVTWVEMGSRERWKEMVKETCSCPLQW